MKKSMDIFGEALIAHSKRNKNPLYIEDKKGNKYAHNLDKYFRKYKQLDKLEKKIIKLSSGKILDVGCGPGNYIPFLNKKGKVLGIDISSKVIKVCKKRGINNAKVANIFNFNTKEKYDTIVLLENNLGMAETIPKTKKLLIILKNLLNEKGQILTNVRDVKTGNCFNGKMRMIFGEKKGDWISWISFNPKFLKNLCEDVGLKMQILDKDKKHYLAKIKKMKK